MKLIYPLTARTHNLKVVLDASLSPINHFRVFLSERLTFRASSVDPFRYHIEH